MAGRAVSLFIDIWVTGYRTTWHSRAQRVFEIRPDETLHQFLERSKSIAADLTLEALRSIESGNVSRTPIGLSQGSYYSWPDREAVRRFRAAGRRL
jgi:methionyl-tRNA formyltransferase